MREGHKRTSKSKWRVALALAAAVILVIGAYFFLKKESEPRMAVREELTEGSFTDIFSGTSWIDEGRTTLFVSPILGEVTFAPKFLLEKTSRAFEEAKGGPTEGEKERIESFLKGKSTLTDKKGNLRVRPMIFSGNEGWYVFWEEAAPVFLKLMKGEREEVEGAVDLSQLLFPEKEVQSARIAETETKNELLVEITTWQKTRKTMRFVDNGFKKEGTGRIVSKNINTFPAEVRRATIDEFAREAGGGENLTLFLSNDGEDWKEAEPGKEIIFEKGGSGLFWKAEIEPDKNSLISPVIRRIRLSYALYFPEGFEVYKERQGLGGKL